MKDKFTLKNITVTLIAVFTIFFLAEYIYSRDYNILMYSICIFSAAALISFIIYLFILFDNRYKLTYADINNISSEIKTKLIKEEIKEAKEVQKNSSLKDVLYFIIFRIIYVLGFFELLLIIHFLITDKDYTGKIIVTTFPAFLALIIAVIDIIKKLKK